MPSRDWAAGVRWVWPLVVGETPTRLIRRVSADPREPFCPLDHLPWRSLQESGTGLGSPVSGRIRREAGGFDTGSSRGCGRNDPVFRRSTDRSVKRCTSREPGGCRSPRNPRQNQADPRKRTGAEGSGPRHTHTGTPRHNLGMPASRRRRSAQLPQAFFDPPPATLEEPSTIMSPLGQG